MHYWVYEEVDKVGFPKNLQITVYKNPKTEMPEKGCYGMCQVVGDLATPLTEIIQEAGVGVKAETD